jgi:hypothetical protein
MMPTLPSNCSPVCLLFKSGLLGMLFLSIDDQLPGVLPERGGLLTMFPLASFNVVIPPDSSRALFSITAAASELENFGKEGRCLGEFE